MCLNKARLLTKRRQFWVPQSEKLAKLLSTSCWKSFPAGQQVEHPDGRLGKRTPNRNRFVCSSNAWKSAYLIYANMCRSLMFAQQFAGCLFRACGKRDTPDSTGFARILFVKLLAGRLWSRNLIVIATLELIQSTQSQRLAKLFDINLFVISFAFAN